MTGGWRKGEGMCHVWLLEGSRKERQREGTSREEVG